MKTYHTYSAIEVAFSLLKHAAKQGKAFTNLQLQKLTYVCHGLSLSDLDRPLIIDDVFAWKYGPVIPSVYFRFKSFGSESIDEMLESAIDEESESIIRDVVSQLGDLTGSQLVELTHRKGSPWQQVWDETQNKIIPDPIIKAHYLQIQQTGHTASL
ncbi:MAG: SocA family protein [Shewanella sp.]|nr:SocA family protein [Shewanella sp.]